MAYCDISQQGSTKYVKMIASKSGWGCGKTTLSRVIFIALLDKLVPLCYDKVIVCLHNYFLQ